MAKAAGYSGSTVIKSLAAYGLTAENAPIIHSGDKLITSDNSSVEIIFNDGSILTLEPNSMVRIADLTDPGDPGDQNMAGRREIRVLSGKITFENQSEAGATPTLLISPNGSAMIGKGTFEFGTDGQTSYIKTDQGDYEKRGNILENQTPELSFGVAGNEVIAASKKAMQAFKAYDDSRKSLGNKMIATDPDAFSAKSRSDRVIEGLLDNPDLFNSYISHMGLTAGYAEASADEIITEGSLFQNHSDPVVAKRSRAAIKQAQKAKQQMEEVRSLSEVFKQKMTLLKERYDDTDKEKDRKALKILMTATLDCNSINEKYVLGLMMHAQGVLQEGDWFADKSGELLALSKEIYQNTKDGYAKTETNAKALLSADEDDTNTVDFYSKIGEVSGRMVNANAGVVTLFINGYENNLIGDASGVNGQMIMDAVWDAYGARDEFVTILGQSETRVPDNPESLAQLDQDLKKMGDIADKMESSAEIYTTFVGTAQRYSMVLSASSDKLSHQIMSGCSKYVNGSLVFTNKTINECKKCQDGTMIYLNTVINECKRCIRGKVKCINKPIDKCSRCEDCRVVNDDRNINQCTKCENGNIVHLNDFIDECKKCNEGRIDRMSGTTCNDGNPCTENDICENGHCRGTKMASCPEP